MATWWSCDRFQLVTQESQCQSRERPEWGEKARTVPREGSRKDFLEEVSWKLVLQLLRCPRSM